MTSKTQHAATLAAVLMDESHFCQSDSAFRDAYFQRTGERYASAAPHVAASDALALIKIGAGVARWAVRACNGEGSREFAPSIGRQGGQWLWRWDDKHNAAHHRADIRALNKAQAIADRYGAIVKLGGDPRGYVVKLILASGRHNTWGGAADGWGVA